MSQPVSRKDVLVAVLAIAVGVAMVYVAWPSKNLNEYNINQFSNMELKSQVFKNNESIPVKYTCDGENVSPPFTIEDVTEGAKSLVLVMDDPDAPGGTWVHWVVWNIPPDTKEIAENSVPENAVLGRTSFGSTEYGGPCPPSGEHRYMFKLYALDNTLDLLEGADKSVLENIMQGHILGQSTLTGLYSRE